LRSCARGRRPAVDWPVEGCLPRSDRAPIERKDTCRAVPDVRTPVACDRRLECQALDRAEKERCRCADVGCGWEIRWSNRVVKKRRHLALVPSMQRMKLPMQSGVHVAKVVRNTAVGETRLSYDQSELTEKHPFQHR